MKRPFLGRRVFALLAMSLLVGCSTENGFVYVSQPEVFTRESLVQERTRETAYLLAKLNAPDPPFSVQGLDSESLVNSFANSLTLQLAGAAAASPSAPSPKNGTGPAPGAPQSPATGGTPPSISINNTSTQTNGTSTPSGPSSPTGGGAGGGTGGTTPPSGTTGTTGGAGGSQQGTSSNSTTSPPAPSITGPSTQPSAAQPTGIELLSDQLAYRNAVNAAMKETMLDDTHDLHGLTLYTLKFDLTIMPGEHANRPLVVLLQLPHEEWEDSIDAADEDAKPKPSKRYLGWVNSLNQEVSLDTQAAEGRLLEDQLPDTVLNSIETSLKQDHGKGPAADKEVEAALGTGESVQGVMDSFADFLIHHNRRKNILADDKSRARLKYAVARWVWHTYFDSDIKQLVSIPPPQAIHTPPSSAANPDVYFSNGVVALDDEKPFKDTMWTLNGAGTSPRGFAIEPKEYAQNISAVSARQDIIDLSLALSAAIGRVNLGDTTSFLRNSQSLLQALKRQPLAIGFGNGRREFGWLFGPPFAINGGEPTFEHVPIRQSFTAEIGIPGWWSAVCLTGRCFWLDEEGNLVPADTSPNQPDLSQPNGNAIWSSMQTWWKKTFGYGSARSGEIWPTYDPYDHNTGKLTGGPKVRDSRPTTLPSTITIPLPTDPSAITTALLFHNDRTQLQPLLAKSYYTIVESTTSDPEQTLTVRGRSLWRNPMVSIGNVKASTIEVMPDMGGLIAHFNQVPMPSHVGTQNPQVDLVVTTTFGTDSLSKAVTVFPKAAPAKPPPFLTLGVHFVAAGQTVQFAVDANKVSSTAAANAQLFLKPAGMPDTAWLPIVARPLSATQQLVVFNMPSPLVPNPQWPGVALPAVFNLDVKTADLTGSSTILNSSPETLVICNNITTDLAATTTPTSIPAPTSAGARIPITIELVNTSSLCPASEKFLLVAYPDLQRAIDNNALKVQIGSTSTVLSATITKSGSTTVLSGLTLPAGSTGPPKGTYPLQVIWTDPQNQPQALSAGTLTLQ